MLGIFAEKFHVLRPTLFSRRVICLSLITLCFLAYANSLNNAFISDDIPTILENPKISQLRNLWLDPNSLFNSLSYLIAGYRPFFYHLASIALHSINTLLVFLFLSLFFEAESSFLASCLFAVHPVHTEAVTWISGRPYLFLAFFVLSAYLLYYRATGLKSAVKRSGYFYFTSALFIFSYALIHTNYFLLLFPLFLALIDITFGRWRKNWVWWLPFIALVALKLILLEELILQRITLVREDIGSAITHNPVFYFIYSFFSHLKLLIWPVRLTFYHDPAVITQALRNYWIPYLAAIVFFLIIAFKKEKKVFLALAIFILFLAPTYSPIPIAALVAERYIYLPSLGLSIAVAFLYERYANHRRYLLPVIIILILACTALTALRNQDWKGPEVFWRKTVTASANSARAHNSMALIYLKERNKDMAVQECKRAIEIDPRHIDAYNNLGLVYKEFGDKERSIHFFKKALDINPRYASAYHNLGNLYKDYADTREAVLAYKKAIELEGDLLKTYNNLASLYISMGENKEAITLLNKALEINPQYAFAHFNLSVAYFNEKEYGLAIRHCDEALRSGQKIPPAFLKSLEPYRK